MKSQLIVVEDNLAAVRCRDETRETPTLALCLGRQCERDEITVDCCRGQFGSSKVQG